MLVRNIFWLVSISALLVVLVDIGVRSVLTIKHEYDTMNGLKLRLVTSSAMCALSLLVALTSGSVRANKIVSTAMIVVPLLYLINIISIIIKRKKLEQD